ncbi:MAG: amino acid deaminase/aldolase, partial [Rhodococcus sp. (in: high G+C Gram-positive bacteria)]
RGARVGCRPANAGVVCARFDGVSVVDADGSRTSVPTYRGEGQCFG